MHEAIKRKISQLKHQIKQVKALASTVKDAQLVIDGTQGSLAITDFNKVGIYVDLDIEHIEPFRLKLNSLGYTTVNQWKYRKESKIIHLRGYPR